MSDDSAQVRRSEWKVAYAIRVYEALEPTGFLDHDVSSILDAFEHWSEHLGELEDGLSLEAVLRADTVQWWAELINESPSDWFLSERKTWPEPADGFPSARPAEPSPADWASVAAKVAVNVGGFAGRRGRESALEHSPALVSWLRGQFGDDAAARFDSDDEAIAALSRIVAGAAQDRIDRSDASTPIRPVPLPRFEVLLLRQLTSQDAYTLGLDRLPLVAVPLRVATKAIVALFLAMSAPPALRGVDPRGSRRGAHRKLAAVVFYSTSDDGQVQVDSELWSAAIRYLHEVVDRIHDNPRHAWTRKPLTDFDIPGFMPGTFRSQVHLQSVLEEALADVDETVLPVVQVDDSRDDLW